MLGQKLGSEATVYLVNFGKPPKRLTVQTKKPELFGEHCASERCQDVGLKAYGLRGVPTTVLNASGETVESVGMKD